MFECDKRDKTFQGASAASVFAVHEKAKRDPGLYRCHAGGCRFRSKAFHWRSDLLQHIRKNHPDLSPTPGWEKCGRDGCQEEYSKFQKKSLQEHVKRHHPTHKRANETIVSPVVQQAEDKNTDLTEQQGITAPPVATQMAATLVNARRDTPLESQQPQPSLVTPHGVSNFTVVGWELASSTSRSSMPASANSVEEDTTATQAEGQGR